MRIYGINPVLEALRAKRVTAIQVSDRGQPRDRDRLSDLVRLAEEQGIPVRRAKRRRARALCADASAHQGVVADVHDQTTVGVEDLAGGRERARRSSSCSIRSKIRTTSVRFCGRSMRPARDGVVRQSRHAARLDGAAAKVSAGAVSHVKIAEVVNIARALESAQGCRRVDRRSGGRRRETLRRDRFHGADGDCRGRGRHRSAAPGSRTLRLAGLNPDERTRSEPQRVGGGGHCAVRSSPATPGRRR